MECLTFNLDIVLVNYRGRPQVVIHFAQRLNLAEDHASAREHRLPREDANSLGALYGVITLNLGPSRLNRISQLNKGFTYRYCSIVFLSKTPLGRSFSWLLFKYLPIKNNSLKVTIILLNINLNKKLAKRPVIIYHLGGGGGVGGFWGRSLDF